MHLRYNLEPSRSSHYILDHANTREQHSVVPSIPGAACDDASNSTQSRCYLAGLATHAVLVLLCFRWHQCDLFHRLIKRLQRRYQLQCSSSGHTDFCGQLGRSNLVVGQLYDVIVRTHEREKRSILSPHSNTYFLCVEQSDCCHGSLYGAADASLHLDGLLSQVFVQHGVEYGSALACNYRDRLYRVGVWHGLVDTTFTNINFGLLWS